MDKLTYTIWDARVVGEVETFRVAVSNIREVSLREEIARGERTLELLRPVAVTDDRNAARAMGFEL
ncbi:MAG: hypothetical protein QMC81_10545 [Thermoanaerobacterales bacterium]|nr:hypothetical protein [Thermoanaerobacterales bacterium]